MSGRRWVGAVIGLLVGNAAAMGILVVAAGADDSHHVVPDYYRKALAWDQEMAAERASLALGWRADLNGDGGVVDLLLVDRDGAPVADAVVTVSGFHRADAGQVHQLQLVSRGGGRYGGPLPWTHAGVHELTVTAARGAERWRTTRVIDLPGAPP